LLAKIDRLLSDHTAPSIIDGLVGEAGAVAVEPIATVEGPEAAEATTKPAAEAVVEAAAEAAAETPAA
jgi:hypothetical protein